MKGVKFLKLGVVMVAALFMLFWGLSYLKGQDFFKPVSYYYAVYDRVDGLTESSHVTVNGYQVGSVKSIAFLPDRSGRLLVTLLVDKDFEIPVQSIAQIVSSDIMGTRAIKLIYSGLDKNHAPGDTLLNDIESDLMEQVSLQVLPLKNKAEELLGTIDSAITVLTVIFNEDARRNLSESFENINQTINNIERASADLAELVSAERATISRLTRNTESITESFRNNLGRFDSIMINLNAISDTLANLPLGPVMNEVSSIIESVSELLARVESGDNTLGMLFHDDALYNHLDDVTVSLTHLLNDIRQNPRRYVQLSAINLGKEVYINAGDNSAAAMAKNIVFKVHLISAQQQIPLSHSMFEGFENVEEFNIGGVYTYLAGGSYTLAKAQEQLQIANRNFPAAEIVAFKEGKNIKLERALRQIR